MSQTQLIILVAVVAALVVILALLIAIRIRSRRRYARMTPEERELLEAERHYRSAVERAEKTLEATRKEWDERVREAEQALQEALRIGYRSLGSMEKVALYEDHIETPEGSFQLANGPVEALVGTAAELAASQQHILSRVSNEVLRDLMARAGGEGGKTYYLLVATPIFVTARRLRDSDVTKARQFASSIVSAASSTAEIARRREEAVALAEQRLEQVKAQRQAAVDAAERELEAVRQNTARLDAARRAVDAIRGQANKPAEESGAPTGEGEPREGDRK